MCKSVTGWEEDYEDIVCDCDIDQCVNCNDTDDSCVDCLVRSEAALIQNPDVKYEDINWQ